MTSLPDVDDETVVDVRADVAVFGCNGCKREQAVELCEHVRIELHLGHPLAQSEHQLLIEAVLDDLNLLLRRAYLLLVLLEFFGDVPFGTDECLLADPLGRNELFVGVTHFEIVAEDIVEPYFQALYASCLRFALLDAEEVVFAVRLYGAQFVQFGVDTSGDDVRPSLYGWRIRHYLPFDAGTHLGAGIELFAEQGQIGVVMCGVADRFDGLDGTQRTA